MDYAIATMAELERALKVRGLRITSAFFSFTTWKVTLASLDHCERFAHAQSTLQQAVEGAIDHCDTKRAMRAAVAR
jgi:hypothetical protein